jgi:hypothetical protein
MDNTHLRHERTHSAVGQAIAARLYPYHWKQTTYNEYTLLQPDGRALAFRNYAALYAHCKHNKINAVQA